MSLLSIVIRKFNCKIFFNFPTINSKAGYHPVGGHPATPTLNRHENLKKTDDSSDAILLLQVSGQVFKDWASVVESIS